MSAAWRRAFGRDKGLVNQRIRSGVVYHCSGRALYRALGAENSRYRRPLDPADWPRIVERVLKAWAALASPEWPWLFSIEAQVALADSLGVPRSALPRRSYGIVQKQEVHFPDRPLIACAGDRLVLVRPHVDDDPVDPAAALRTWWRHYRPFIEAVGAAGVSVSLKLVRSATRPADPAVDQLLALWEADDGAAEAVRDIWFTRQEARRLEGGHPPVVAALWRPRSGRCAPPRAGGAAGRAPRGRRGGRRRYRGLAGGGAAGNMVARLLAAGSVTVWWVWAFPLALDDRFLLFIREQTPAWYWPVVAWSAVSPGVLVLVLGFVAESVWRVWFERYRPRGAGASRLPSWPLSPDDPEPAIVIGEVHHRAESRRSASPGGS